jgi:hypothetical protein
MAASSRESPRRGTVRTCASGALTFVRPRLYPAGSLPGVRSSGGRAPPPAVGPRPSSSRQGTPTRRPRQVATVVPDQPDNVMGLCNAYLTIQKCGDRPPEAKSAAATPKSCFFVAHRRSLVKRGPKGTDCNFTLYARSNNEVVCKSAKLTTPSANLALRCIMGKLDEQRNAT